MGLLEELAVRCEAATGADYALTMEIVLLDYDTLGGIGLGVDFDPDLWMMRRELDPVTSMDAAMMLVPDKHWVQHLGWNLAGWRCLVERQGCSSVVKHAATPALALTAASLRARHALALSKGSEG